MFDYINCAWPLPDDAPTSGYQTKDTPAQQLTTYTISEKLTDEHGDIVDFTGVINFYTSNVTGFRPGGYITEENKPAKSWEFSATFRNGNLLKITGGEETNFMAGMKHLTVDEFWDGVRNASPGENKTN